MADGLTLGFEVEGLEELTDKLDSEELAPDLKEFFSEAATEVQAEAKILAPVGETGYLQKTIIPSIDRSPKPLYAEVTARAKYAPFVEYGHKQQVGRYVPAIGKRLVGPWVEGKPFMEPALRKSKDRIIGLLKELAAKIEARFGK